MSAQSLPHPGVRFPPPLLFVAGLLGGWLAHRRYPLPILPGSLRVAALVLGYLLLVCSAALTFWALRSFRRVRTSLLPNRPAVQLVITGPFRYTRNPMYLSLTTLYLGLVLLLNSWWPLLLLPIVLLLLQLLVITREERYLAGAFGAQYESYRSTVRRWL